jgi:hypothetical protein
MEKSEAASGYNYKAGATPSNSKARREAGETLRSSVVAPAQRSPAALEKTQSHRTTDGLAVHSFPSLLQDLATLTLNKATAAGRTLQMIATPTSLQ